MLICSWQTTLLLFGPRSPLCHLTVGMLEMKLLSASWTLLSGHPPRRIAHHFAWYFTKAWWYRTGWAETSLGTVLDLGVLHSKLIWRWRHLCDGMDFSRVNAESWSWSQVSNKEDLNFIFSGLRCAALCNVSEMPVDSYRDPGLPLHSYLQIQQPESYEQRFRCRPSLPQTCAYFAGKPLVLRICWMSSVSSGICRKECETLSSRMTRPLVLRARTRCTHPFRFWKKPLVPCSWVAISSVVGRG